jgi:hypothetical protein
MGEQVKLKKALLAIALLVGVVAAQAVTAKADSIYSGSDGTLFATADFNLTGSTLTITLTNTSGADVLVRTDVLTGVFFNTTGALTPVSASLNGSSVFYGSTTNPGDGWGYASGVRAHGENSAISAAGHVNRLGHSNFSGASNALGGLGYGILSAGFTLDSGQNGGVTRHGPLIQDSVQFTLTAPSGFSLSERGSSVISQYGTSLSDTDYAGKLDAVPESGTLFILGSGLAWLVGWRW